MYRNGRLILNCQTSFVIKGCLVAGFSLILTTQVVAQCSPAQLLAYDPHSAQQLGSAVAIADEAGIALIGANQADPQSTGAAYVFMRDPIDGSWDEHMKLVGSDAGLGDFFGDVVAITPDAATMLITAGNQDPTGAVYVFEQRGSIWLEQTQLTPPDSPPPPLAFGRGLAISEDGTIAAIGAWKDTDGGNWAGAVYIFERKVNTSNWSFQVKLIVSDAADDARFGQSLDLSADGNILVGGANQLDFATGAAYVFVRNPKTSQWAEQIKLTASDAEPIALFGSSVAISGDGNTILVGASDDDEQAVGAGAAYVYVRNGNNWFEQAKLTAFDGSAIDGFGTSVALSADGNSAVIGAVHATSGFGAAYYFTRHSSVWIQQSKFGLCDGDSLDLFGERVDISADGQTALVGSRWRDLDYMNQGAAYVYDLTGSACSDITGDGIVDIDDLVVVLAFWGPCAWPFTCLADLNGDCTTSVRDLLILFANWG
ncbi:MAG: hypothetical protein IH984_13945 [Planctomycetes bacterium]|nr:hypothetical protein [Planctomycetota bacterium]